MSITPTIRRAGTAMAINKQMKRFFRDHRPSRDRRKCSCGWTRVPTKTWVEHLAHEMEYAA